MEISHKTRDRLTIAGLLVVFAVVMWWAFTFTPTAQIYTDANGCEYLVGNNYTPRMKPDGHQICHTNRPL